MRHNHLYFCYSFWSHTCGSFTFIHNNSCYYIVEMFEKSKFNSTFNCLLTVLFIFTNHFCHFFQKSEEEQCLVVFLLARFTSWSLALNKFIGIFFPTVISWDLAQCLILHWLTRPLYLKIKIMMYICVCDFFLFVSCGFFIQFNMFCVGFTGVFLGILNFNLFANFINFL